MNFMKLKVICSVLHSQHFGPECNGRRARDLGLSVQLTNIARDVVDDWKVGRVYLPLNWLKAEGLSAEDMCDIGHRPSLPSKLASQLFNRRCIQKAERHAAFSLLRDMVQLVGLVQSTQISPTWDVTKRPTLMD